MQRPIFPLSGCFSSVDGFLGPGDNQGCIQQDRFAVVNDRYFYFENAVRFGLLQAEANRRVLPLYMTDESETNIRTEIMLPPGYRRVVIAPASSTFAASDGSARGRTSTTIADGKVTVTQKFERTPAIVSPEVFVELQEIESKLENTSSRFFLLERDPQVKPKQPET